MRLYNVNSIVYYRLTRTRFIVSEDSDQLN